MNIKKVIAFIALVIFIALLIIGCSLQPKNNHEVKFLNKECIVPLSKYNYETCAPLDVEIDNKLVVVPKGFETDLASIPHWYWLIIAPHHASLIGPGILHDYFYRCKNDQSRLYADEVFYYALKYKGLSNYNAGKFYLAVRLFGGSSYVKSMACH